MMMTTICHRLCVVSVVSVRGAPSSAVKAAEGNRRLPSLFLLLDRALIIIREQEKKRRASPVGLTELQDRSNGEEEQQKQPKSNETENMEKLCH